MNDFLWPNGQCDACGCGLNESGKCTNVDCELCEQTFRIEIRFDFTGNKHGAMAKAHEVAGNLDGGMVAEVLDENFEAVE